MSGRCRCNTAMRAAGVLCTLCQARESRAFDRRRRLERGERLRFVALVRPGPSRHRAAVYYVEASTAAWARRFVKRYANPKPTHIRLREVTEMGTKYVGGLRTTRIPPMLRLWSVA